MDTLKLLLPKISDKDRTQLTDVLLEFIAWQQVVQILPEAQDFILALS